MKPKKLGIFVEVTGDVGITDISGMVAQEAISTVLRKKCASCYHYDEARKKCFRNGFFEINKFDECEYHVRLDEIFVTFNPKKGMLEFFSLARNKVKIIQDEWIPEKCIDLLGKESVERLVSDCNITINLVGE